jgi:hypothetical protein
MQRICVCVIADASLLLGVCLGGHFDFVGSVRHTKFNNKMCIDLVPRLVGWQKTTPRVFHRQPHEAVVRGRHL